MRIPALPLALSLALGAAPLAAQQPSLPLSEGERIRIAGPTLDPQLVTGRVAGVGPGWIAFRIEGEGPVYSRRLDLVDQLAVRRERSRARRALRGAAWGVFLGGSAGGMSAPFVAYGMDSDVDDWQAVGTGAGAGLLVGGVIGALVGMALPSSDWQIFDFIPTP